MGVTREGEQSSMLEEDDGNDGGELVLAADPESQLNPDRHPQIDLFICDVADAPLRDLMQGMEHPIFSLAKKPDLRVRKYEYGDYWVKITPSVHGLPNIWDKDILIFAISQVVAKTRKGETFSPHIRITPHELLIFTNRGTGGAAYSRLCAAIDRLAGARISTNIKAGGMQEHKNFGLIDDGTVVRKYGKDGRLLYIDITLSRWVMNAIVSREVLTLSRDYFRIKKAIDRRIYEIARKHCGHQKQWEIGEDKLFLKSGSRGSMNDFRRFVRLLAKHNHLPDYRVEYFEGRKVVRFTGRGTVKAMPSQDNTGEEFKIPNLPTSAYEQAKLKAPGMDVYLLEADWRDFVSTQDEPPKNFAGSYVGFCQYRYKLANK